MRGVFTGMLVLVALVPACLWISERADGARQLPVRDIETEADQATPQGELARLHRRIARLEAQLEAATKARSPDEAPDVAQSLESDARRVLAAGLDKIARLPAQRRFGGARLLYDQIIRDPDLQAATLALLRTGGTDRELEALVHLMMWSPFATSDDEVIEGFYALMQDGDSAARRHVAGWAWSLHALGRMSPKLAPRVAEQLRDGTEPGVLEAMAYVVEEGELYLHSAVAEALPATIRRLPVGPASTHLALAELQRTQSGDKLSGAYDRWRIASSAAERETYAAAFAELLARKRSRRLGRPAGQSGVDMNGSLVARIEEVYSRTNLAATRLKMVERIDAVLSLTRADWEVMIRRLSEVSPRGEERTLLAGLADRIRDGAVRDTQTMKSRLAKNWATLR